MYIAGKIASKELLLNYLSVSENSDKQLINGTRPEIVEQVFTRINTALSKAALNNCSEIEETFSEKIDSGTSDLKSLKLIAELMQKSNCISSDFYGDLYEKLNSIEPSADYAYTLAWYYIRKEKFEAAVSYLKKSIELEKDTDKQAHYYYQLALICNTKMKLQEDAVNYAQNAINLLPSWGEPYFVIANAYILGSKECFEGAFERESVYWVATDKCIKAKNIDKTVEEKANGLIADFVRFFPNNEEIFFRSLQEGNEYTVGCWINEKTIVRVRK